MTLREPITLGAATAPGRLMFGPHVTNLGRGRTPSERHVAYYVRRAAGGAGVIVVETAPVHESDWPYERAPLAADCGPGWAAIAKECAPYGPLVLASLGHAGGQGTSAYSQREMWAPSGVPEVNTREMPKVMEPDDIAEVVAGFGAAARLAVESGLGGVEVNAGQHSLVRQFLSGLTNQRDDAYGADRLRFAREVLGAVREALGDGVLGLRLSCDELAPWAGVTPEQAPEIAAALAPLADYLVVVRGAIYSGAATRPDSHTEPGFNLDLTRSIKAAVGPVPVFAQGSIVEVAMAERALADGIADGVEMTRAQIADAELGRKAAEGRAPRPCILCNQACQVQDNRNPIVSCVADPRSGHETEDADPDLPAAAPRGLPAAAPRDLPAAASRGLPAAGGGPAGPEAARARHFLVVGGGPAGLEAARVAALRGHRVTLAERAGRLGGTVVTAAAAPTRARLAELTAWLAAECERLGVTVETGRTVTADEAAAHDGPVVIATGARDAPPGYEVADGAPLVSAYELLGTVADGGDLPDGPVLIWDPIGGPIGVSIAELLIGRGPVTLAFPDQIPGQNLALSGDLATANTRLRGAGVEYVRRCALRRVTRDGAELEDAFGAGTRTVAAALVVDAGARLPAPLTADAERRTVAGDAVAPRTIHQAVLEGRRAVLEGER
ncbi:MAG: NAD(P)-binding protein [Streptosporangiales bacterium]|nr:NAD(P)-binding protein [Streptosporangiales bacterium]